jgi:ClpP class serine protease
VKQLATGEIYTTEEALANKLVDSQGFLRDAIQQAVSLAGLPKGTKPTVTIMQPPMQFSLANLITGHRGEAPELPRLDAQQIRSWVAELSTPRLEYRMHLGRK